MNIRIGNDIVLNVALDADKMSGKSLLKAQCYLIADNPPAIISSPKSYIPTEYSIHGCGTPHYNAGVGAHPHDRGFDVCSHGKVSCPSYALQTEILSDTQLQCYFTKEYQSHLGRYKLIVEVGVQDPNDVYTYTFDYGAVFSLTDKIFGKTGEIVVDVPNVAGSIYSIQGINKSVAVLQGSSVAIGSDDQYGFKYGVLVRLADMTTAEYNPADWVYSNLKFKSSDPSVVTVNEYGTIAASETKIGRDVIVTVYDEDDFDVNFDFNVHVVGSDSDESVQVYSTQVFDPLNNMNQSAVNSKILGDIHAIENLIGKNVDGMYIVVTGQNQYEQWSRLNQIKDDTFYFTYDEEEYPDGPDGPDGPDVPTGDSYVENHILYTSGSVSGGILTISGTVNNNTLIL